MFQGLQESQIAGALEALLFVTDEPVGTLALADMLEVTPADVERALVDMREVFERENRGIQLREVAGGWRIYTHPVYHELIEKYVLSWDTRKLSQAATETLSVVAYSQPVTRAGVASVRGVNSDSSINSLVEKGLVREAGNADAPGNPTLYTTTRAFLEKFGLRSTADLPDLDQFAPDDATRAFIRDRLSATREPEYIADEINHEIADGEIDAFAGMEFDFDSDGEATFAMGESLGRHEGELDSSSNLDFDTDQNLASSSEDTPEEPASPSAQNILAQAMATSFGLVEKIDFDNLTFETDDE